MPYKQGSSMSTKKKGDENKKGRDQKKEGPKNDLPTPV